MYVDGQFVKDLFNIQVQLHRIEWNICILFSYLYSFAADLALFFISFMFHKDTPFLLLYDANLTVENNPYDLALSFRHSSPLNYA